ncbi:MAG: AraC family transcriptional regulator ligand-binding domain-containing protein [Haliea sp.]|nr:AraC family transcriptional regulator ligand-binding domain-containing protein [Haliea sp.]
MHARSRHHRLRTRESDESNRDSALYRAVTVYPGGDQDDSIGLHIGRELACANYYALGYAAANGDTLFDALHLLPRYESLVVHRPTPRSSSCNTTSKYTGR